MTGPPEDHPRLLGDVGGTHARWAWVPAAHGEPTRVQTHRCADHPSAIESARRYLADQGLPPPRAIGLGIATALDGDAVRLTNHPWSFSLEALRQALGAGRCVAVNDFTALALSLPLLRDADLRWLGGNSAVPGAPLAVLGPGTGLGVSGLVPDGRGGHAALAGEGGHVTLAAADDHDAALIAALRHRWGHVSAERVLSGPGLEQLYQATCTLRGAAARALGPADIARSAQVADDPHCVEAVQRFSGFLGNVAGNLALTLGARGGVYVGGGVVPRLGTAFDVVRFRERFESKGRFASYLRGIPTWLIVAQHPALLGASRALDLAPTRSDPA
jgi:glucokinase